MTIRVCFHNHGKNAFMEEDDTCDFHNLGAGFVMAALLRDRRCKNCKFWDRKKK